MEESTRTAAVITRLSARAYHRIRGLLFQGKWIDDPMLFERSDDDFIAGFTDSLLAIAEPRQRFGESLACGAVGFFACELEQGLVFRRTAEFSGIGEFSVSSYPSPATIQFQRDELLLGRRSLERDLDLTFLKLAFDSTSPRLDVLTATHAALDTILRMVTFTEMSRRRAMGDRGAFELFGRAAYWASVGAVASRLASSGVAAMPQVGRFVRLSDDVHFEADPVFSRIISSSSGNVSYA